MTATTEWRMYWALMTSEIVLMGLTEAVRCGSDVGDAQRVLPVAQSLDDLQLAQVQHRAHRLLPAAPLAHVSRAR